MIDRRDMMLGVLLLAIVGGLFLVALVLAASLSSGAGPHGKSVGVIEITGTILSSEPVATQIERCIKDDNIPVILVRIDSPGGGVTVSQEIYEMLLDAKESGKPLIASMGTVAASGGYYIASACDTIMAMPSTITGSIGVIMTFVQMKELLEKVGIEFPVVKSGIYKDMGSFTRDLTEEERDLLQGLIMDTYDQFVEVVAAGRGMDEEYVRQYADGRVFTGRQAVGLGFVDTLGTERDAIRLAGQIAGLGDEPPVYRQSGGTLWQLLAETKMKAAASLTDLRVPGMMYLWSE